MSESLHPRIRLRDKLCRELAGAEHDARIQTRREARRLGDSAPGRALLAISEHAAEVEPVIAKLVKKSLGTHVARALGDLVSKIRHVVFGRFADSEESYRASLIALQYGADTMRLLREVVILDHDAKLIELCDRILVERLCLIEEAEQALLWFAEHPERALRSHHLALPAPAAAAVFAIKV
jgi:hypothetical protein